MIELDFGSFQLVVKYPNPSRPYPPEPPCKLNLMSIDQTPERSINSFRTRCRRAGSASFGRRGGSATSTGAKTPRFSPPSRTDGSGLQQVNLAFSIHNPILDGGPCLSFLNRQNLVHFQACVWRRPRIAWTANGVTRAKGESRSRTTASSKKRFVPA